MFEFEGVGCSCNATAVKNVRCQQKRSIRLRDMRLFQLCIPSRGKSSMFSFTIIPNQVSRFEVFFCLENSGKREDLSDVYHAALAGRPKSTGGPYFHSITNQFWRRDHAPSLSTQLQIRMCDHDRVGRSKTWHGSERVKAQ